MKKCASDMTKKAGDKFANLKNLKKSGKDDDLKKDGKKGKSLPPWLTKKK